MMLRQIQRSWSALSKTPSGGRARSAGELRGPLPLMEARIASRELSKDPHQLHVARLLQTLYERIVGQRGPVPPPEDLHGPPAFASSVPASSSWISSLSSALGFRSSSSSSSSKKGLDPQHKDVGKWGLYLWGGVGCGKTMLMDMFFDSLGPVPGVRRAHFNEFMLDVHSRVNEWKKQNPKGGDPIIPVAQSIMDDSWVLCFDEMQVTDVANAMIIRRLFDHLFRHGLVIVATSNRPPSDLYLHGLQRDLFLPFISQLQRHCVVHHLNSGTDYRRLGKIFGNSADWGVWNVPLGESTTRTMDRIFAFLAEGHPPSERHTNVEVDVMMNRKLRIPVSIGKKIARISFDDLCAKPLGAADYIALGRGFEIVILDDIPQMDVGLRSEARRFITLIDELYESKTILLASAAVQPEELFVYTEENRRMVEEEIFAFERACSRLREMQSIEYLERVFPDDGDNEDDEAVGVDDERGGLQRKQ